jgi:hypothetical protein
LSSPLGAWVISDDPKRTSPKGKLFATFGEHNAQGKALRHEKPQDFSLGINPQGELSAILQICKEYFANPPVRECLIVKNTVCFQCVRHDDA